MKIRRWLSCILVVAAVAPVALAADVAGRWTVTISTAEGTIAGLASLKQSGDEVTGWVGPSENDPIPVTGKFKSGKLVLKTHPQPGRSVAFDEVTLTIDSDTMGGVIDQGSHGKGSVKFARSK